MTTQETIDRAERVIAGLQWPTPHSSAHIAQALSDVGLLADPDNAVSIAETVAKIERDEARDTIRRLNRRAQLAEAALHKQLAHPYGAQDPTVEALAERVRELEATIQRVRDLANLRDVAYPAKFRFGAAENYVLGVHDARRAIREALDQGDRA